MEMKSIALFLFIICFHCISFSIFPDLTLSVYASSGKTVSAGDIEACNIARKRSSKDIWEKYLQDFPEGVCLGEANAFFEKIAADLLRRKELAVSKKFYNFHANLFWSDPAQERMIYKEAAKYCDDMGGRLPTISELRTLVQNCPKIQYPKPKDLPMENWCKITRSLFSEAHDNYNGKMMENCRSHSGEEAHNVFGDTGVFWSSTKTFEQGLSSGVFVVGFHGPDGGYVSYTCGCPTCSLSWSNYTRCVLIE